MILRYIKYRLRKWWRKYIKRVPNEVTYNDEGYIISARWWDELPYGAFKIVTRNADNAAK